MFQPVLDSVGNWLRANQTFSPDLFDMWSIDSDDNVRIRTPPTTWRDWMYAPPFFHIDEYDMDELIFDDPDLASPEPEDYD